MKPYEPKIFFRFYSLLEKGPLHHKDQSPIGGGVVAFLTQGFEAQTLLEVRILPGPVCLSSLVRFDYPKQVLNMLVSAYFCVSTSTLFGTIGHKQSKNNTIQSTK